MTTLDPFGAAPPGQVEVLRGRSRRAVRDSVLALQARGIQHLVQVNGAGARVLVPLHEERAAVDELVDFAAEAATWREPAAGPPPIRSVGLWGALCFGLICILMFPIGQKGAFGLNWWDQGLMSAARVRDGEIWRTVTALTLHVDAQHLVGNLVFGTLFGVLAAQALGYGLAWACTLGAGAAGNLVEAFLTSPDHTAVGASTAIFGTLGLMASAEWTRRGKERSPWVRRVAPLFGGAVLFGWLGVGDGSGRVDVLAHATGFTSGALLGIAVARLQLAERFSRGAQAMTAAAALGVVAFAWFAALRT
ncbi:MAG: rhomboid family intramembrane serine protease [Planctomycetota bacterium]|nr:rhomboid family intramembrane serine protease [Planctomycetota bacterium]MDG1983564.1 rhomboid family intramembrane serine protease [Planctomycetota bacterium]